ncbi:MAG: DUF2089 family protein [Candidatus Dormibacteria bacterium]
MIERRPPRACPVCGDILRVTRLGCHNCGTELSGDFESCEFCSLSGDDRQVLMIFLTSRGNMKALERQLGVSYPTARARLDAVLNRLGIDLGPTPPPESPLDLLQAVARGDVGVADAAKRLLEHG